jgi:hypothetical protein
METKITCYNANNIDDEDVEIIHKIPVENILIVNVYVRVNETLKQLNNITIGTDNIVVHTKNKNSKSLKVVITHL